MFYNKYNRVREGGRFFDEDEQMDNVQRAGYRTVKQQVEELLSAGKRLDEYRRFAYQWPDGVIPDDAEPANRPNDWDVTDQRRVVSALKSRLSQKSERPVSPEAVEKPSERPADELEKSE